MNQPPLQWIFRLLCRCFVKTFYRRNAGQFVFVFIVFFGVVGPSMLLHYHYGLILGMLSTPVLFAGVFLAWFAYSIKCAKFVLAVIQQPGFLFLDLLNRLDTKKVFALLWGIQFLLLIPISFYAIAVVIVALHKGWYSSAIGVSLYILFLNLGNPLLFLRQLQHPGIPLLSRLPGTGSFRTAAPLINVVSGTNRSTSYWSFFLRYLFSENKLLLAGIKVFSCGMLWLTMRSVTEQQYDIRMQILIYSIGIFGHGVLIYKFRELEEKMLFFYRGLPVKKLTRIFQYGCLYFLLFIPEIITISRLAPRPLHLSDALAMLSAGYAFLLFLNSILFTGGIKTRDYLVIVFCLFLVLYVSVLAGILSWLALIILIASLGIFWRCYYRFEG